MTVIVSCQNLTKSYGPEPLFSALSFGITDRDRLGIIGPNGSGKSSLLKLIAGVDTPDEGQLVIRKGVKISYVGQTDVFDPKLSISSILNQAAKSANSQNQDAIVNRVLGQTGFADPEQKSGELSGGWRKRLAIAVALVEEPDLLLLDEPTNHLDLQGISWLEGLLRDAPLASVIISHDRFFLDRSVNRMLEINKIYSEGMYLCEGNYKSFLFNKAAYISGQKAQQASLANKAKRELEWLRSGVKARTTKQQARIQAAGQLQSDLAQINQRLTDKKLELTIAGTSRKTKKLLELKGVSKSVPTKMLFSNINAVIHPEDRLGVLGGNGAGKSTLLKILADEILPDTGEVERARDLKITYFDQNRAQLNPEDTVKTALAPDSDHVVFCDKEIHVASWATRFLFSGHQLHTAVKRLSGGEQARLQVAKFLLQPADVIILDEPTNDLDIPTLEALEDSLKEFPGAIIIVTHDRFLLRQIASEILYLDDAGNHEFFADFDQWQKRAALTGKKSLGNNQSKPTDKEKLKSDKSRPQRLSYMEQREFDQMEAVIETAETELKHWQERSEQPEVTTDSRKAHETMLALGDAQKRVDALYARWAELEKKKT